MCREWPADLQQYRHFHVVDKTTIYLISRVNNELSVCEQLSEKAPKANVYVIENHLDFALVLKGKKNPNSSAPPLLVDVVSFGVLLSHLLKAPVLIITEIYR